jgi:hypothetical protein
MLWRTLFLFDVRGKPLSNANEALRSVADDSRLPRQRICLDEKNEPAKAPTHVIRFSNQTCINFN